MKDKEKIQISGKQTKVGKSLTIYAKDNIFNTLKKYFSNFISADVLFSKDKFSFIDPTIICEILCRLK